MLQKCNTTKRFLEMEFLGILWLHFYDNLKIMTKNTENFKFDAWSGTILQIYNNDAPYMSNNSPNDPSFFWNLGLWIVGWCSR